MLAKKTATPPTYVAETQTKYNQINKIIYAEKESLEVVSPMPESNQHL